MSVREGFPPDITNRDCLDTCPGDSIITSFKRPLPKHLPLTRLTYLSYLIQQFFTAKTSKDVHTCGLTFTISVPRSLQFTLKMHISCLN